MKSIYNYLCKSALILLVFGSATALAQTALPFMIIDDASVFEGNSGTSTILKLPVRFIGTQSLTVTGQVSAIPLTGNGFSPATGGSACGGNVDFVQFTDVPFSIPPNTSNGTFSVNISICGDTVIEPNEQIFVFFSNVSGADCSLEGGCNAVGTIINDDGLPAIQINNISVSTVSGIGRNVAFTVSLNHPSALPTTVHFATRDGTAQARTLSGFGDYVGDSGTLTIQPNTLSSNIVVRILGTGGGTFFMDLSQPVNGTIADGTGQATIHITTLIIGAFDLSPDNAQVQAGDKVNYALTWTVPEGEVWRNLKSLDFRIRQGNKVEFLVHWDEAANTFTVCEGSGKAKDYPANLSCTQGAAPGSPDVLETSSARLFLADSSVVGSGPTGRSVTLNLAIGFKQKAEGHFTIELAAADDFGGQDNFTEAGTVRVDKAAKVK